MSSEDKQVFHGFDEMMCLGKDDDHNCTTKGCASPEVECKAMPFDGISPGTSYNESNKALYEICGPSFTAGCIPERKIKSFDLTHLQAYDEGRSITSDGIAKRRLNNPMSFVGVEYFAGKIIAFADRRSSVFENGALALDEKQPDIKKLWKADDFVSVFCGTNSFASVENDDSISVKPVYIEQWLAANFSMYSSPEELCKNLYGYILKHSKENFGEICVISAGRQSESVYFSEACISLHSFHMEAWNQSDWRFRINGSDFHKQYFAEHSSEFLTLDQNLLCVRLENINTKYAKKFIEKYNPVGSRWDVEIF